MATLARTPTQQALRRFLRSSSGKAGLLIVGVFVLLALLAPLLAPYDPAKDRNLRARLQPPSIEHPMGTDELGRDMLIRVWHGSRISLRVGVVAVGLALVAGTLLGLVAGFFGGWVDTLVSWLIDIMLAFPSILLAIAIVAVIGPGIENAMLAVGVVQIPVFARLARSMVLSLKEQEFVAAARALGATNGRILLRHILPNGLSPLIVQATLSIATAILDAAGLGFLGLGAQPPAPEWGVMIARGFQYFTTAPWISLFPGLAIMLAVLGFNLLGDGLRDALDPRTARP